MLREEKVGETRCYREKYIHRLRFEGCTKDAKVTYNAQAQVRVD